MFNGKTYVERDSHGRERLVIGRSSSHGRSHRRASSYPEELFEEAKSREQTLIAEVSSLQTRLSVAQRDQWHLQQLRGDHQRVVNEHYQCRNMGAQLDAQVREVRRLDDLLLEEEHRNEKLGHKNEKLEEKIRLLKRGSVNGEEYQRRYEEKLAEVEMLRVRLLERDEQLRVAESRIVDRESRIVQLTNAMRDRGFRLSGWV